MTLDPSLGPDRTARLAAALGNPLVLGAGWSLLRLFCLRSAGFPIDRLAMLAAPALQEAWQAVQAADDGLVRELAIMRKLCLEKLDRDRGPASRPWRRALNRLDHRRAPTTLDFDPVGRDLSERIRAAEAHSAAAAATLQAAVTAEDAAVTDRVRALAAVPAFGAAVAWQNRDVLQRALYPLLEGKPAKPQTLRGRRKAAALYLQRYHAKNEHIGFFGPAAWGAIAPRATRGQAGPQLMARLDTFYEWWAMEALLQRLEAVPGFRRALSPVLSPSARMTDDGLLLPDGLLPLDALQRRFIMALDGSRSAAAIIDAFSGDASADLAGPAAYEALLTQLDDADIITWSIILPVDIHPEDDLARALASLPAVVGAPALAALARLNAARAAVASAGDDEIAGALAEFDRVFERETATGARRFHGKAYAGRTPLYCDGLRAFDFTLGDDVVTALAPALGLVLDSARWFCNRLVHQYLEFVSGHAATLAGRFQGDVPLSALWSTLQAETETALAVADDVIDALQEKWRTCLGDFDEAHERRYDAAALRPAVAHEFALDGPTWPGARFQSPDLMLAAASDDAIARGEWLAVLGELHVMTNLMAQRLAAKHCPIEAALLDATARVQALPELVPAIAHDVKGPRTAYSVHLAHDIHIEYERNRSWKRGAQVVRMADLVARRTGGDWLVVSLADGRVWPLLQFIGPQLRSVAVSRFKPLRLERHLPRLTIDRLVFQREAWRYGAAELDFVRLKDRAARYLAIRRWAVRQKLPRHLFYRLEGELKPLYLDLHSLVYADLFADGVRALGPEASVTLAEMLPAPEHCWLTDADGHRYTAEFRMAAFPAGDHA